MNNNTPKDLEGFDFDNAIELDTVQGTIADWPVRAPGNMMMYYLVGIENPTLHTEKQMKAIMGAYNAPRVYARGDMECSIPESVKYRWQLFSEEAYPVSEVVVESADKNFSSGFFHRTVKNYCDMYNQMIGTKYYWRVYSKMSDGRTYMSAVSEYVTEDHPCRFLKVDGLTNVRDIGGWKTESGQKVLQNMIFRSSELNLSGTDKRLIEDNGIRTLRNVMRIKTELDLRKDEPKRAKSLISPEVAYFNYPFEFKDTTQPYLKGDFIKEIFEKILADRKSYPILAHCQYGADRTGMLIFLILGMIGVSKEDAYKDYLFTNFGNIGSSRTLKWITDKAYAGYIDQLPGETFKDRVRKFLNTVGISYETMDKITQILLEKEKGGIYGVY